MKTRRPVRRSLVALVGAGIIAAGGGSLLVVDQASAAPASITADDTDAYPVLKAGANGSQVRILQHLLVQHGQKVDIDGSFGPKTTAAVKSFQSASKIASDGVVGKDTWSKILVVGKQGTKGEAVKGLQQALNENGAKLTVNGNFDATTEKAVKSFQQSKSLDADGIAGPNTWGALLGVKADSGTSTPAPGKGSPGPDTRYPNPKKTYANGNVPSSQLCRVPGARSDEWRMACRAVPDFKAMSAAYKKQFGKDLEVDHLSLTAYRTVGDQQVLWNKYGSGRAARPGTSNHGWGMALDINMNRGSAGSHQSATYKWLHANGPTYGFKDTVPHEDWHFDYQR